MLKKCIICGKEFNALQKNYKCCSKECSAENFRRYVSKYHSEYDPDEDVREKIRERLRAKNAIKHKCPCCHKQLPPRKRTDVPCDECMIKSLINAETHEDELHIKRMLKSRGYDSTMIEYEVAELFKKGYKV